MTLRPRTRRDVLLAGCFLLLLGQVCPWTYSEDNREICLQPKDEGPCKAKINAWYYDRYSQTCEKFVFGGCGGTYNNFATEAECKQTCYNIKRVTEQCRLDIDTGSCRARSTKYFFNMYKMRCESFTYRGCEGNENRFMNKISCLEFCLPGENHREICLLPEDTGLCRANLPRYYYDSNAQICNVLMYGGCRGNENRFVTMEDCETSCRTPERRALSAKREDQPYAYDP